MKTTANKQNGLSSAIHSSGQNYSVRIGNQLLRQLPISCLREIQQIIHSLLIQKQNLLYFQAAKEEGYQIHFDQILTHYADNNSFHIVYSMDTCDGYLQCTSARQMRKIALSILTFLNLLEREESDKQKGCSLATPSASSNEALPPIDIQTDPLTNNYFLEETPAISQQTHWSEEEVQTEITYRITVNDQELEISSLSQLLKFRQKLVEFLDKNTR